MNSQRVPGPRRRPLAIAGVVLALCAVAVLILVLRESARSATPGGPGMSEASRGNSASDSGTAGLRRPGERPGGARPGSPERTTDPVGASLSPGQDFAAGSTEAQPGAPPVAFDLIERFAEVRSRNDRQWRQYPRNSHAIAPGAGDPVLEARKVTRRERFSADGHSIGFTFYLSTMNLLPGQELLLYGIAREGEQRVRATSIVATILPSERGSIPYEVELNDDGRNGDEKAGDQLYTGSFRLPAGQDEAFKGAHTVQGVLVIGDERVGNGAGFLYSIPKSKLTGTFRDALVDRSLIVYAQVEAWDEARFHVEATVYGGEPPQPIGWAQNAAVLPRGLHEIPIEFYGLMFTQAGFDGPYLLRYVSLRTTQGMPNDLSDMLVDAHRTAAYRVSDFTDQPFSDTDGGTPTLPGAP